MDKFTRNYAIGLAALALALLGVWIWSSWTPRVWEINAQLEKVPVIADYPYRFRVLSLKDGVATVSTPRSFEVPAMQFVAIVHPEVAGLAQDDPRMIKAQQGLIDAQKTTMVLVQALPDVKSIQWELDVRWLADHGVVAPATAP